MKKANNSIRTSPLNTLSSVLKMFLVWAALLTAVACATAGYDFPSDRAHDIQTGETTKNEIRTIFGSPWRVGLEDGQQTWTYGKYKYKLFGNSSTKDLVIRFNAQDIVSTYSFNTTDHNE